MSPARGPTYTNDKESATNRHTWRPIAMPSGMPTAERDGADHGGLPTHARGGLLAV